MVQEYFLFKGYDPAVCQCFVNHKITGAILLELDLAYLKEIDITSFGTRFEISKDIKQLLQLIRQSSVLHASSSNEFSTSGQLPPTPVSKTNSVVASSTSSGPQTPNGLMSPPQFKRQSVLRSANENALGNSFMSNIPASSLQIVSPPKSVNSRDSNSHKKDLSFDPNWVHPATLKKQQEVQTIASTPSQRSNGGLNQQKSRIRSSTISTADQYYADHQSTETPPMPSSLIFSQFANPQKQTFTPATSRQLSHSRQGSKDTIRASVPPSHSKHSRSTSSLGLSEFQFLSELDIAEGLGENLRLKSGAITDMNPLPVPEKDLPRVVEKSKGSETYPNEKADAAALASDISLDTSLTPESDGTPKRSSTSAGTKKRNPILRSASSHSNLKSKTTFASSKQKTSAFQEGINTVSPADAAKSATFSGWMNKRGTVAVGTWKARFFCLHGTRLSYFTSFNDDREKGLIDITSHRVVAVGDSDDKFVALYAASVGAGRFCFKVVPPLPGTRKGVTFTMPKVHYFAVDSREEMRCWMAALMKATIDRDDTAPVISSCATPTVPLVKAQEMFAEARAREEMSRAKAIAAGESSIFAGQINSTWLNGFGQYGETPNTPDSTSESSFKSSGTEGTNTTGGSTLVQSMSLSNPSSVDYFSQPPGYVSSPSTPSANSPENGVRHITAKTAGLRVVTDLSGDDSKR